MDATVRKQIILPRGVSANIQRVFNVSERSVQRAIIFDDKGSGQGKVIRAAAMQRGGVLVDNQLCYRLTDHTFEINENIGEWRFIFTADFTLTLNINTHELIWLSPGVDREYTEVNLDYLYAILTSAQAEYERLYN